MHNPETTKHALISTLAALNPEYLALENESHKHANFFAGKESHFKLVMVSHVFDGLRLAARHQQIYALAAPFLTANGGSVHALAIFAYTPTEWQGVAPDSPNCAGAHRS